MGRKHALVPRFFEEARRSGASKEELMKLVRDFCLEAIQHEAAKKGDPIPQDVDKYVVRLTYDLYEEALSKSKEGA